MRIGHSKILYHDVNTHCPYGWMTLLIWYPHDIPYTPSRVLAGTNMSCTWMQSESPHGEAEHEASL